MRYSILSVLVFFLTLFPWNATATAATLPDLIIDPSGTQGSLTMQTFAPGDCVVVEGCIKAGTRRLLKFGMLSLNIGSGDVIFGSPVGNPLFHFHTCHGHYHFEQFAEYRLLDSAGNLVATGTKAGFCIEDDYPVRPGANPVGIYDCDNQGLQPGWGDYYGPDTVCQWIDITGVPPGAYTLELEIDPAHLIAESDESNNFFRTTVAIDAPCVSPPANDNFSAAQVISGPSALVLAGNGCATREPGEPSHAGNVGGHSLWYRWTASVTGPAFITTEGSTFHTMLTVYHGDTLTNLTVDVADGDIYRTIANVAFNVTAGVEYFIAVDGYNGASGGLLLSVNPALFKPPHFDAITRVPDTGVHLTLSGNPGDHYELQSADALGVWTTFGEVTNLFGTVQITDSEADNSPHRYYRAVLAPIAPVMPSSVNVARVGMSEQAWAASDVWIPATLPFLVSGSKALITLGCWWDSSYSTTEPPKDSNGTFVGAVSQPVTNPPVQVQIAYQADARNGSHIITPPVIGGTGDGFLLLVEAEGLASSSQVVASGRSHLSHPFYGHGDPNTIESIKVSTSGFAARVGDLAVALFVMDPDSNPNIKTQLPAGWTLLGRNDNATDNVGYLACYKIVETAGIQSVTFNWTDDSTFVAEAAISVFKAENAAP